MAAGPDRYPIPGARIRVEQTIKGSRFITTLAPAATVEEARAFMDSVRSEFPDATHHCWAHVIGPPGTTRDAGMSDDGEPGGTAGRPMLTVLLHSELGDVVVVVTRYFGGVKLGGGGLARAYGGGAQRALTEVARAERVRTVRIEVGFAYPFVDAVRRAVAECGGNVLEEEFGEGVSLVLDVPASERERLVGEVTAITSGSARIAAQ